MANGKIALVFPGQGCQSVGMGADLYETFLEARALYERADEILGFPLSSMCFEGPAEALNDTANTQPAIYVTTMALWQVLGPRLEGVRSDIAFAAGHSLGEFSALAATGAIDIDAGLELVRRRGEAMRDAGETAPGGMAVIIGLADEVVAELVAEANLEAGGDGPSVWMANYNSPGQVVISGESDTLDLALALAKERKAKRALRLSVSVACHTPLMEGASERLAAALEETTFSRPWVPVVSNVEARPLSEPDEIKSALLRQLSSPVRWVESIQHMVDNGITGVLEIGPKAVVSGLIKRIHRDTKLSSVTNSDSLNGFDEEAIRA